MDLVKVKDSPFVRDINSRALLNTDINEKNEYLSKVKLLKTQKEEINIDDLCIVCKLPMGKVSAMLLNLEFSGIVKSLPGKMYKLN